MIVPFDEWLPDQAALGNPGAMIAENVIPYASSYGELRDLQSFTGALNAACVGSVWAKDSSGSIYNHAGTASQLLELQADFTWDNVSKSGNYSGASAWEWTQIGDRLIAVDIGNTTQYFDLGTSTLYADLSGSPPNAAHIATIRNFVVMGNIDDGTAYPSRLVWSGYNDSTVWTPSRSTQSDTRDLRGRGGDIQKIVPGQYGVVYQQNSISLMEYSGPPVIFTISEVEKNRGALAANSVCWTGATSFFLSTDGFYAFTPGGGAQPIGSERINRWFFNTAASSSITQTRGSVDRKNNLVIWAFKSDSSLDYFDYLLFFNWVANRWSYAQVNVQLISDYLTTDVDIDSIDSIITNLDATDVSLDSDAFRGGVVSMIAFDTTHKAGTFSGDPLDAVIETKEIGDDRRSFVSNVRPLVDGANATVTVSMGTRNTLQASPSYSLPRGMNSLGEVNFRSNARYQRARVTITGGFDHAQGVEVTAKTGGRR